MQAGFALLTCGLVRKKNAGHLMMLNFAAYVFAFLAYYAVGYAFQFGAVAVNAAPTNLGGTPTLNHFLLGSGAWGFLGGKGFFLSGPAYDAGSNVLTLFQRYAEAQMRSGIAPKGLEQAFAQTLQISPSMWRAGSTVRRWLFRAGNNSGSAWRARWRSDRRYCCWTSRAVPSTRFPAASSRI